MSVTRDLRLNLCCRHESTDIHEYRQILRKKTCTNVTFIHLFIWGFALIALKSVQVISQWAVLFAEENSTCGWSRFFIVNWGPSLSN